jgi:hypothetical protein
MRSKIIKVKDEGTSLKYYIVLEPGIGSKGKADIKDTELMERYGWGRRYGQYPYIIIDPGFHAKASAVISHFCFPGKAITLILIIRIPSVVVSRNVKG